MKASSIVWDAMSFVFVIFMVVGALHVCFLPTAYIGGVAKAKWAKEAVGVDLAWYETFGLDVNDLEKMKKCDSK